MGKRTASWLLFLALVSAANARDMDEAEFRNYQKVIEKTVAMVSDTRATSLANRHGLQIMNVTWEDTGRSKGSSGGPNISDMTIQVQLMDPETEKARLYCMPVIRFPNFSDRTGDLKLEKFFLLAGNQKGEALHRIGLKDLLGNLRSYLSHPESWKGKRQSLLAERDTHVLVSAQACFLPIPKQGEAHFNPVLFNYQSVAGDPAVLAILVTREGTSATVIDNQRDGFRGEGGAWGQRLFFNLDGERTSLTATRLEEFREEENARRRAEGRAEMTKEEEAGLNLVMLIQVPLKQKNPRPTFQTYMDDDLEGLAPGAVQSFGAKSGGFDDDFGESLSEESDVDEAVIGHGEVEGPYTEIDDLEIERDENFPVRVTVQFYKATSNGVVSPEDLKAMAEQIEKVYSQADYVGSLVVEGETGRPTEHSGPELDDDQWWSILCRRHPHLHDLDREQVEASLRKLYGARYRERGDEEILMVLEEFSQ